MSITPVNQCHIHDHVTSHSLLGMLLRNLQMTRNGVKSLMTRNGVKSLMTRKGVKRKDLTGT